jgi:fructose-1,6-bisphosphatase/inositol monophosphatase family enzyme
MDRNSVVYLDLGNVLNGSCFTAQEGINRNSVPYPEILTTREGTFAAQAAAIAGTEIRRAYRAPRHIERKAAGDYVTEVDYSSEAAIVAHLSEMTPNIPIISEESSPDPIVPSGRVWVIDPLDGTSAFLFKTDPAHPAVMISLLENCMPIVSIVYLPLVDRWFCAEKGQGAWIQTRDEAGCEFASKVRGDDGPKTLSDAHVVMNHYGDSAHETRIFRRISQLLRADAGAGLVTVEPPNSAVSCRMMDVNSQIAAVVHDNSPKIVKQALWDIAPILLFVEEAGGYVCDPFGNPYTLGSGAPIVVARNRHIYHELFRRISPVIG